MGVGVGDGDGLAVGDGVCVGVGVGVGVGDGDGLAVGDGVCVGLWVGVGLGVGVEPVIVMRPSFCRGDTEFKSASMNSKSFGDPAQINGLVAPGVLLSLSMRILNNTPDPLSGVIPSLEKADTRRVLSEPGPGNVFAETVQPLAVRSVPCAGGTEKLTTAGS